MMPEEVRDRAGLIEFIAKLRSDLRDPEWEGLTLDAYLEAMQAWLRDADGVRKNTGIDVDSMPPWELAATVLLVGQIYA